MAPWRWLLVVVSSMSVPLHRENFRRELLLFRDWYNEHRPLSRIGQTQQLKIGLVPAN
jgi:hypothetical protein